MRSLQKSFRGSSIAKVPALFAILIGFSADKNTRAQNADATWIGKHVFQKSQDFRLFLHNRPLEESGKRISIYRVDRVDGDRLWLFAPGLEGWAKVSEVVDVDEAIDYFTTWIRAFPQDPWGYHARSIIWAEVRKDFDLALRDSDEEIRLCPNVPAYNSRGLIHSLMREYDKAIDDFNAAIRLDPAAESVYNNRGNVWIVKMEYDKAIADYTESVRIDPGRAASYMNRGNAWFYKKEYHKAIVDYNEAIRLEPKFAMIYNLRGRAKGRMKEYDNAIKDFNEAIRLDPMQAWAYLNRGFARFLKEEIEEAIADYDEAIRLFPKYNDAYLYRGDARFKKKDYDKAIADYDEAIRLDPKSIYANFIRAVVGFITAKDFVVDSARTAFDLDGGRGDQGLYASLIGHFAARRAGKNDEAKKFLEVAKEKCDKSAWPYPVIKYLLNELSEPDLLGLATDDDKRTEAHCYIGLDQDIKGRSDLAIGHYQWVKEHGNPEFTEYTIVIAELDRLEKAGRK